MSPHTLTYRMLPLTTRGRAARLSINMLLLFLVGCTVPISYYDVTTYKHLTELKVEAVNLVGSFDVKTYADNKTAIETFTVKFQKAYEYERGKGEPNSDTAKQFKKLSDLFHETVREYQEEGPSTLGPKYFKEAANMLGQAFDIAIATENEKNQDKR